MQAINDLNQTNNSQYRKQVFHQPSKDQPSTTGESSTLSMFVAHSEPWPDMRCAIPSLKGFNGLKRWAV